MTEDDGVRVTNRDVYNALIEFRKEFGDYVKEQGPRMAVLEYEVKELKGKIKDAEDRAQKAEDRAIDQNFTEKQTRRLYLWGFAGSSVLLEIANFILFHK